MLHILMLTDRMDAGGAETHILTLCQALIQRGDRVTLLSSGGMLEEEAARKGVLCRHWPADKRTPYALYVCGVKLRTLVKKEHFDIVHAHTRMSATLAHYAVPYMPVVTTAHLPFPAGKLLRRLMHWGNHTLAVSEDIAHHLRQVYALPQEGITLTKNGIDTQAYAPVLGGDDIVHVSRLDTDRALTARLLCRIAPKLLSDTAKRHIHIIGGGTEEESIRRAAAAANRKLGYEGVLVYGKQRDVRPWLRCAAVFVGVSRAALEAASMHIPVILCGNEGYGGILTEDNFDTMAKTNFCARATDKPEEERLFCELKTVLSDQDKHKAATILPGTKIATAYSAASMAQDAIDVYKHVLVPTSACIIGYYGYKNAGDEAMLSVIKEQLMQRNVYNIRIISHTNSEDKQYICRRQILRVLRAIRSSEVILFGGGNLLQNETSRRSLLAYRLLLLYAAKRHKRTVMIGMGIGALHGRRGQTYARQMLMCADGVFLRTTADFRHAKALLGVQKRVYTAQGYDVCFSLPEYKNCPDGRILFVLRKSHSTAELMAFAFMADRLRRQGYRVALLLLFPTQDNAFGFWVARRLSVPLLRADSYTAFTEQIYGADLVVTERLHGAVFSLLCHTPCCLLDTSVKNHRLIEDVRHICRRIGCASPVYAFSSMQSLCHDLARSHRHFVGAVKDPRRHGRIKADSRPYAAAERNVWFDLRKRKIGGTSASDFTALIRALRATERWDKFVFYEELSSAKSMR